MTPDDLMFKPDLMKGHRILITGGGTGLGKEMAEGCLMLGAEVLHLRPARRRAAGGRRRADGPARRQGGPDRLRHPRAGGDPRHDGRDLVGRRAHRPRQQRRRQLHQPHRGPLDPRLRRHLQHRLPRLVLRHAGRRQALAGGEEEGLGGLDPDHLGLVGRAVHRAVGDVEGRAQRDDPVAGGRVGQPRGALQRHRARPLPHRRRLGAAQPGDRRRRRRRAPADRQPARPRSARCASWPTSRSTCCTRCRST